MTAREETIVEATTRDLSNSIRTGHLTREEIHGVTEDSRIRAAPPTRSSRSINYRDDDDESHGDTGITTIEDEVNKDHIILAP